MNMFSNGARVLSDTGKLITQTEDSSLRFVRISGMKGIPSLFTRVSSCNSRGNSGFDRSHESILDELILTEPSYEGRIGRDIRAEGNRATRGRTSSV